MRCHRLAASVLVALLAIGFHGRSTASSYVGDRLGEEKASTPLPAIAECGAFENCVQCSVNSECGCVHLHFHFHFRRSGLLL